MGFKEWWRRQREERRKKTTKPSKNNPQSERINKRPVEEHCGITFDTVPDDIVNAIWPKRTPRAWGPRPYRPEEDLPAREVQNRVIKLENTIKHMDKRLKLADKHI